MWYVEVLPKTYNAVDQTFYDAITINSNRLQCVVFLDRV